LVAAATSVGCGGSDFSGLEGPSLPGVTFDAPYDVSGDAPGQPDSSTDGKAGADAGPADARDASDAKPDVSGDAEAGAGDADAKPVDADATPKDADAAAPEADAPSGDGDAAGPDSDAPGPDAADGPSPDVQDAPTADTSDAPSADTSDAPSADTSDAPSADAKDATGADADACVPTGAELCDNKDNDCNGLVDDLPPRSCYGGPAGTLNVGECKAGTQTCVQGQWGVCLNEVLPSPEKCDGKDNNCDGPVDEGNPGGGVDCGVTVGQCVAKTRCVSPALLCVGTFVAPPPIGAAANPGTSASPLASIGAAIANAVILGGGRDVCVCSTGSSPPATFAEDITMVQGTSVIGGYSCSNWQRSIATYVTRIQDTVHSGVKFPTGITTATALDGLTVLGLTQNNGTSAAITITNASPSLVDLTVSGGASPTSYGLQVTGGFPVVTNGRYTATGAPGGVQVAVLLDGASPSISNAQIGGANVGGTPPATSIGVRCVNCAVTSITGGSIQGGTAATTAIGLWASGNVQGLNVSNGTVINGGSTTSGSGTPVARGVFLDSCSGSSTFTGTSILGGVGSVGGRIGVDAIGSTCGASITSGSIRGCEAGQVCVGLQANQAPVSVTSTTLVAGSTSGATAASYGMRCIGGGCGKIMYNRNITAGFVTSTTNAGIGLHIEGAQPLVDSNQISGPGCNAVGASTVLNAVYIRSCAPTLVNNVILDGSCNGAVEVVRFDKTQPGPISFDPVVVNNTIEYTTFTGAGARRGIAIASVSGMVGPAGFFNNNIVRNVAAGGVSWPFFQIDADSDVKELQSNDLWDPTATALFQFHGTTPLLTIDAVNATVPGAKANISADPLLNASWHMAPSSKCRNAGSDSHAPDHDFDAQKRPQESGHDIGADEYQP
jgi:hypothetical protein